MCLALVDCTDCPIQEPSPFDPQMMSHKIQHAALRYEIAVGIQDPNIVWCYGPFKAGEWPDILIARQKLVKKLGMGEYLVADSGYKDGRQYFLTPTGRNNRWGRMFQLVRARHENFNSKIKAWKCTSTVFRHSASFHGLCFHAVVNVIQLQTKYGDERTWDVNWDDKHWLGRRPCMN